MYDYVIVGAGSAGCVLASRLSEDPAARVLLLEAGPPDRKREIAVPAAFAKLFGTEVDWAFRSAPEDGLDGRSVFLPRGRTLGGSSSINAMIYQRGDRADFDEWAARGNPGWGYDDLLPCFVRAEGGPLRVEERREHNPLSRAFTAAAVQAGIPHDGVGLLRVTNRRGRRWSVADAYLHPARRLPNLDVLTDAHAVEVVWESRRANGIAYRHGGERRVARAAREVIVAAGAVGSPQLLMLSGVGPGEHLRAHGIEVIHDVPGVGQNLVDHPIAPLHMAARGAPSLYSAESPANLLRWLIARRGPLASNVGEAAAFVRTSPDLPAPDLELLFAPVLFVAEGLEPPPEHGFTIGSVALRPLSRGTVALRSPDPQDAPVIRPGYLSDPDAADLHALVHGLRLSRTIARGTAFERWRTRELGPADAALERWIRATTHGLYHLCGTCRMGPDPLAVVDAELRVHGVERLRVVDASVMPTIVRGHTNAATIAIAERAADLIRARDPHQRRLTGFARAADPLSSR